MTSVLFKLISVPRIVAVVVSGLALGLAGGFPVPTRASEAHPALQSAVLLPGWRQSDGLHVAGLDLRLAPGWKTYWRSPGEAGLPPVFDWSGTENMASIEVRWPRPQVFDLNGMRSIGYAHGVVLPLQIQPLDPDRPIHLRGRIDLGVCEDICIPLNLTVDMVLPVGLRRVDPQIAAALAAQPDTGAAHGLGTVGCVLTPAGRGVEVAAVLEIPPLGGEETAVIESGSVALWVTETTAHREGDRLHALAQIFPADRGPVVIDRGKILITLISGQTALEIQGCPTP